MATRLIIDGNAVYEIDEECLKNRQRKDPGRRMVGGQETGTPPDGGRDRGSGRAG